MELVMLFVAFVVFAYFLCILVYLRNIEQYNRRIAIATEKIAQCAVWNEYDVKVRHGFSEAE